jgi:hypothetical protein
MQVVDIHPHVIAADHARYPLAPVGDKLSAWAARRPVTCEQLLAAMDGAGGAQAVLVQAYTHSAADRVASHPGGEAGAVPPWSRPRQDLLYT